MHEFHFTGLEIPVGTTCGEKVMTTAVDDRINDELRQRLGLLTPEQMRNGIDRLVLTEQALAERLGVPLETISHWVNGRMIQPKAMDNLLRLFIALPEVRQVLTGASQDRQLGIEVSLKDDEQVAHGA